MSNANSRAHAAYLGKVMSDGYAIVATYKGRRKDELVASFDKYDDMIREWDRITTLCGMVDVYGTD